MASVSRYRSLLSLPRWLLACGAMSLLAGPLAADSATASRLGRPIADFVLPDAAGKPVALSDFSEARVIVVAFLGTQCPIANSYLPALAELQERHREQGLQVLGVNSVLADDGEKIAQHGKEFQITFPVLVDAEQVVADQFAARRTPEVFVLDRQRVVRYRGRIDDRVGYTYQRAEPRRADLQEAVRELLAGQPIRVAETEPTGCLITRKSRLADPTAITFSQHVAPILQRRCAECHHPGTAAPFSLLTYEDADQWSDTIREAVAERRMPPWNADPRHGRFSNDIRLSAEEIDTVLAWIDQGKPRGDSRHLPAPRTFADGWLIGQPDLILKMPKEYTVPASGTVEYQYFVTPTNFEQDMWVQASEARPGNWKAVHHIIAWVRDPKTERGKLENLPMVGGYAPGEEPMVHPAGTGFLVPAGSEILWQVHYTPTGKVETDQSEVGLIFCKEPPPRQVRGGGIFNFKFIIPPHADHHRVTASKTFSGAVDLVALMPHMHLRGKSFTYTARFPDGRSEILLNVPRYDFSWQHRYRFAEPVRLPPGTTIECVAHFDNSADNPANPDPAKTVKWGDQTWEEMMIGWYSLLDVTPPSE